jgi:hypothetical protein
MRRFIMSQELPTLDPLASFVDVGSEHMHVSVGGNKPEVFGTVTSQLHALRDSGGTGLALAIARQLSLAMNSQPAIAEPARRRPTSPADLAQSAVRNQPTPSRSRR